ncbi:MAG TPA: hypothetical protein V6C58_18370 [Allocoleopsis sp.]
MNTISSGGLKKLTWQTAVICALGFWLSSSIILDMIIMPTMYASGMIMEPDFVSAGYSMFWIFNRVELVCAGIIITGFLIIRNQQERLHKSGLYPIISSVILLAIAMTYTYILAPNMSALGMELNLFEQVKEIPATMNQLHFEYWGLEGLKFVGLGTLLGWCWRQG